jgi:hypothetical protein
VVGEGLTPTKQFLLIEFKDSPMIKSVTFNKRLY